MASSSRTYYSGSYSSSHSEYSDDGSESEATQSVSGNAASQQQPQQPPVVLPAWFPQHPWLIFPYEEDHDSPASQYARISHLEGRVPCAVRFLDLSNGTTRALLEIVQDYLSYTVHDMFGNVAFVDHSFGQLISIAEPSYPVLNLEFFASLDVDLQATNYGHARYMSFRLGGERRYCSLYTFVHLLGLYPAPQATSFAFQQHLSTGLVAHSDDFHPETFWPTIAEGNYHSEVVVSSVRSTPHRFLARYILLSLFITCPLVILYSYFPTLALIVPCPQAGELLHPPPEERGQDQP